MIMGYLSNMKFLKCRGVFFLKKHIWS